MKNRDISLNNNKELKEIATTLQFVLQELREIRKEMYETLVLPQRVKNSPKSKISYKYLDEDKEDD